MNRVYLGLSLILVFSVSACQTGIPEIKPGASLHSKETVEISKVPMSVLSEIKKAHPDFRPLEAEKELKHGNTYYDIENLICCYSMIALGASLKFKEI